MNESLSLSQFVGVITAIGMVLSGFVGVAALLRTRIDRRKSVSDQLIELNDKLTSENARLDKKLNAIEAKAVQREAELQAQLAEYQRQAAEREQALQQQITDVQRASTQRELEMQQTIDRLNARISKYTEEIETLRQQLATHKTDTGT
jgi:Skp family chaperone for outer membrane proteins